MLWHTNFKVFFVYLVWSVVKFSVIEGVAIGKNPNESYNNNMTIIRPTVEELLDNTSILFGLTKVSLDAIDVNSNCCKELQYIRESILRKDIWALKVLDASAAKLAGFMLGQNFWLGSHDVCTIVRKPATFILSKQIERNMSYAILTDVAPFEMDYRVVLLEYNAPLQVKMRMMNEEILHVGLCMPVSCTLNDIKQLFSEYIKRGMFPDDDIYEISPKVLYVKDLKLQDKFFKNISFKILIALILWSSIMIVWAKKLRQAEMLSKNKINQANVVSNLKATENSPGYNNSFWMEFIKCYDLERNFMELFATNSNPKATNDISAISGFRFLTMFMIVYIHSQWFTYHAIGDKPITFIIQDILGHMLIGISVIDIFVAISAFLNITSFLRNTKQLELIRKSNIRQNIQQFLTILFQRFLRLAPLYYVITLLTDLLYAYFEDTLPHHIDESHNGICTKNAWYNLFFVQNLIVQNTLAEQICGIWTWSVAVEMQLFTVATIFLFIYAKYRHFAKRLFFILFAINLLWIFGSILYINMDFTYDFFYSQRTTFYTSPFIRALPYMVSAMVSWCLVNKPNVCFSIAEPQRYLYALLASIIYIALIDTKPTYTTSIRVLLITFYTIGRVLVALLVCWTIVRSALSMSNWWLHIYEFHFFKHFDRMMYAISLLNPLAIMFFHMLVKTSIEANGLLNLVLTIGFMGILYMVAIPFTLVFEMPYRNISKNLYKRHYKLHTLTNEKSID